MRSAQELDVIRRRWEERHRALGLPDPSGRTVVSPAGLGRRVEDLSTRIVILPADPTVARVEFDGDLWEWWEAERSTPFGGQCMWNDSVATMSAAARVRSRGDGVWQTFLALHRHGGIEIGTGDAYELNGGRCFRLIRTVGLLWMGLDLQADALHRFDIEGPWQITLALHDTEGAYLGQLAEGWQEPGRGWRVPSCVEPNVLLREEVDEWPSGANELQAMTFRLGARIEDAWGVRQRRFLANRGEYEGKFDPRPWRL